MSANKLAKDIRGVLRGLEKVATTTCKSQCTETQKKWQLSSVKSLLDESVNSTKDKVNNLKQEDVVNSVKETIERSSMVYYGIREFIASSAAAGKGSIGSLPRPAAVQNVTSSSSSFEAPTGILPEDLKVSELVKEDKELIQRLEKEYETKLENERLKNEKISFSAPKPETVAKPERKPEPTATKFVSKQVLNPEAKQRKVPSSRIGRMVSFGGLAAGLGIGTIAEATRRTFGFSENKDSQHFDSLFLNEANAERIVNTLCRVRGAALKIGQILSIQDNNLISPGLQKAFERVRQSADFMPSWQVQKVLAQELGEDWRSKLGKFEEKPFAAASIGQVHHVTLLDGREAAMKIQYPGVAQGIDSDINNLVGILKIWNVFPKGMFIDNLVEVAKKELAWEVDYEREKECTNHFRKLLAPHQDYTVPQIIDSLSSKYVLTSLLIDGLPVDQCVDLDEPSRLHVARLVMNLCLLELFEFRYMQTDPNWSNFFYNPDTRKLALLDFGASRSYSKEFMDQYIEIIKGAADIDRDRVLKLSRQMGFLTGYETKTMEDAHVDAVMILGEVFSSDVPFDFGQQDTTRRIHRLVPTIVAERLCAPPEEIYSLHRKLSGVFLLCAKLKVKMSCRDLFLNVYKNYDRTN